MFDRDDGGLLVDPVVGGRAGDDAVEVVREALRFLQALLAAGRAAVPVRELRRVAVESRDRRSSPGRPSGGRPTRRNRSASRDGPSRSWRGRPGDRYRCWPRHSRAPTARASAGYGIEPDQPPLPTAWNLPFHPATGSHTSTLISESLVGVSVAATRQNAGSDAKSAALFCPPVAGSAGVKAPAATGCASVMVAWGSASFASVSQEPPAACAYAVGVTASIIDSVTNTFLARIVGPSCRAVPAPAPPRLTST